MHHRLSIHKGRTGLLFVALLLLFSSFLAEAAAPLVISKAAYNKKTNTLNITAQVNALSGALSVLHGAGGILVSRDVTPGKQTFSIPLTPGIQTPCSVDLRLGDQAVSKKVAGAPLTCLKTPDCKILSPKDSIDVQANTLVPFKGLAKLKDKKAAPLRYEWDFAGGAMGEVIPNSQPTAYKRPDTTTTSVAFVRDNASYRVRFTAWDKQNRYCEASVMVNVGTPPTTTELPDVSTLVTEAQKSAAKPGSQLTGNKDDVVVLPFADLTMPGNADYRHTPNIEQVIADGAFSNLNAVVYRKDRKPVVLDADTVTLIYRAASSAHDPVARNSINSTSQNWPLNPSGNDKPAALSGATIAKTDFWQVFERPANDLLAESYTSRNWPSVIPQYNNRIVGPDEGLLLGPVPADPTVTPQTTGRYMPGKTAPYAENLPQTFTSYDALEQKHLARAIPLTDIDDQGKVNPFPLLRVEVEDKTNKKTAAADAVVAAGRDVHCRECHAKGKIGASDTTDWESLQQAFHSSRFYGNRGCWFPEPYCSLNFAPPEFFEPASSSLFDQEFAANRNIASLHAFYDNTGELGMANGWYSVQWSGQQGVTQDQPNSCNWCHGSHIAGQMGLVLHHFPEYQGRESPVPSVATLSAVMHNWHALLQLDPDNSGKIKRNPSGRPMLWDPAKGLNPFSLFPTVTNDGKALPMEENCLRCHSGHREQLYRDRMYTAGVTCYDCHGDMLAVGGVYDKPVPGPDGYAKRFTWYEQPNCGSCHTGNANQGADGSNGFYSAGVKKRAFDDSGANADRSATSRTPASQRFAVLPGNIAQVEMLDNLVSPAIQHGSLDYWLRINQPLFRQSRDTHGNVPCAACHGGAHENWPNRDPKANDNVLSRQLQGHDGNLLECNVCHTADAFAELENLDGGLYMKDVIHLTGFVGGGSGVLGGPHNLHPVADENWWKEAKGNVLKADDTGNSGSYGGWHNDLAKQPGKSGEDQCAACHGNDHKGTRLSKTPVDRVFDFRNLDFKRLKKAGFKSKLIKVSAGTEIGCDTCHSIKTSCISSPAGDSVCGKASNSVPAEINHNPVIVSTPVTTGVIGQPYEYKVVASDPDGDKLTFDLATRPWDPDTMTIAEDGTVRYDWPAGAFYAHNFGSLTFPYTVRVTDGKGGYATQTIPVTVTCPAGKTWVNPGWSGSCEDSSAGVSILSTPSITSMNVGQTYTYQLSASSQQSQHLSYSLIGAPGEMTINAETGLIAWLVDSAGGEITFTVKAEDSAGGTAYQNVKFTVCASSQDCS